MLAPAANTKDTKEAIIGINFFMGILRQSVSAQFAIRTGRIRYASFEIF